jgi:hypothetical protein
MFVISAGIDDLVDHVLPRNGTKSNVDYFVDYLPASRCCIYVAD